MVIIQLPVEPLEHYPAEFQAQQNFIKDKITIYSEGHKEKIVIFF